MRIERNSEKNTIFIVLHTKNQAWGSFTFVYCLSSWVWFGVVFFIFLFHFFFLLFFITFSTSFFSRSSESNSKRWNLCKIEDFYIQSIRLITDARNIYFEICTWRKYNTNNITSTRIININVNERNDSVLRINISLQC